MTVTQTFASKTLVAFVATAMVFSMFASAANAQTQTAEELQKTIDALMAQIAALSATPAAPAASSAAYTFTRPLTLGSTGADVTALQTYLIGAGFAIPAGATGYFGAQTQSAVAAWQTANGIAPAAGYFGPVSQAKYMALMAAVTPTPDDEDDEDATDDEDAADLQGEGTLDSFEMDDASDTDIQEGAEDEVIAEITMEATDGDIEVDRLTFEITMVLLLTQKLTQGMFSKLSPSGLMATWLQNSTLLMKTTTSTKMTVHSVSQVLVSSLWKTKKLKYKLVLQ